MPTRDVVLVGASAGGVEALRSLVAGLPTDLPATVLVVLHVPPTGANALAAILDRAGPLPARPAAHGEQLRHGEVLVATPDLHLLLTDDHVALGAGPRENGHRPAVDTLFRSAARAVGSRAIAVVLSGALDDGAAGLVAVRAQGGLGVVQDPADALYDGMPRAAVEAASPEHVVPLSALPGLLAQLTKQEAPARPATRELLEEEIAVAEFDLTTTGSDDHPGEPSGYSCPDCSGVLWRIEDHGLLRFRCRVGHAWSPDSLQDKQTFELDGALWIALRSLEERAALAREMSERARANGHHLTATRFGDRAVETGEAARTIRRLLTSRALRGPDGERTAEAAAPHTHSAPQGPDDETSL
ncbi:chemotaxis protein CheB [Kineococcus rhizosphaerae]|uniref:protein-glutamate methylesterase n=1 Tax=Kineococcus rhizosphaerae TaxID=559628 RepID=A0A2T0R393_9ACTN|nr:chemotaxis protein CheB [Kineococcus rhizosphaerae]PRY14538.1 two-component system chemotaxis response regulator CheB [Kineococcus rhizosphaerae]